MNEPSTKKTLFIYGAFGIFLALQLLFIDILGISLDGLGLSVVAVIACLLLLVALSIDSIGLLCVAIAWLPFQYLVEFEVGIITLNFYTACILVFLVISLITPSKRQYILAISSTDILIILLCFSYIISTFRAENIITSGFLAFHALFIPVVSYWVVKSNFYNIEYSEKLLIFLVGGICVFAIYALMNFSVSRRLLVADVPPISAAAMFVCALIFVATSSIKTKYKVALFSILLLALFSTYSRGYFVLILLVPFVYKYIRKGNSGVLMISMLLLSLIATVTLAYQPGILGYGQIEKSQEATLTRITNFDYWKHSLYGRGYHYRKGLENVPSKPVFGTGMVRSEEQNIRHNFHVEWLEYGGLLGYILYCSVFITHFRRMRDLAINDKTAAASLTVIIIILLNGLTNSFTIGISTYLVFLLMAMNEILLRNHYMINKETSDTNNNHTNRILLKRDVNHLL